MGRSKWWPCQLVRGLEEKRTDEKVLGQRLAGGQMEGSMTSSISHMEVCQTAPPWKRYQGTKQTKWLGQLVPATPWPQPPQSDRRGTWMKWPQQQRGGFPWAQQHEPRLSRLSYIIKLTSTAKHPTSQIQWPMLSPQNETILPGGQTVTCLSCLRVPSWHHCPSSLPSRKSLLSKCALCSQHTAYSYWLLQGQPQLQSPLSQGRALPGAPCCGDWDRWGYDSHSSTTHKNCDKPGLIRPTSQGNSSHLCSFPVTGVDPSSTSQSSQPEACAQTLTRRHPVPQFLATLAYFQRQMSRSDASISNYQAPSPSLYSHYYWALKQVLNRN